MPGKTELTKRLVVLAAVYGLAVLLFAAFVCDLLSFIEEVFFAAAWVAALPVCFLVDALDPTLDCRALCWICVACNMPAIAVAMGFLFAGRCASRICLALLVADFALAITLGYTLLPTD